MAMKPVYALYVMLYSVLDRTVALHAAMAFSYLEPVSLHAGPVCQYRRLAVLGRVRRLGEEHALVASRLFVLAYAAWLLSQESPSVNPVVAVRAR